MSGNEAFEMKSGTSWSRGLENMLHSGLAHWFKTRTWWVNGLIFGAVVIAVVGSFAFRPEAAPLGNTIRLLTESAGLIPAMGVVIAMQDALVGEKRGGTAAWVLSKPATRQAFLLSIAIANSLGVLVSMVVIPSIIGYILVSIDQQMLLNPISFLECMLLFLIVDFFFLSLMLMLGALFNNRAPVIAIPFALVLLQQFNFVPSLGSILPLTLISTPDSLAISLFLHTPIPQQQWRILGTILIECVLFVGVALWRFNREEF
jgi:ABC-2 type transport system permease protein